MAVNYATLPIIRDGLQIYIDIANSKSYDGTSTLKSLIGTTTMSVNGATYSTEVGGMFSCDGSNDFISTTIPNLDEVCTVSLWMKTAAINTGMMMAFKYFSLYANGNKLGFNRGAGDQYGINLTQINALGLPNQWKYYTLVFNRTSTDACKMYINGSPITLAQQAGSAGSTSFDSGNFSIGCWNWASSPGIFSDPKVANIKIYNRELTAVEVVHNYQIASGRIS